MKRKLLPGDTREVTITKNILAYLKMVPGCYARKTVGGPYGGGWPDIVGCWRGRMLALEIKTRTGRCTPLQTAELVRWEGSGALAGVVRSVEDVALLLKSHPGGG